MVHRSGNTDRAWQLFGMNRFDLAEKELHAALAREPNDSMAHAMLGYVLARRGEFGRAHQEIHEAIGRDPGLGYAHFVRSWTLGSEKKYEAARLAILEALRIWPDNTDYLDQLSWLELCLTRPELALAVAQAGLRIDPKHTGCLNCLAMAWSFQGQPQRAVQIMDQALSLEPLSSRLHTNLGWIRARADQPERALEHFCEGLRLEPESADSREAFQQGVASAVETWRRRVVLRAAPAGGAFALFAWGSVWAGVVLVPVAGLLAMLISTTFVLQLFPLGRSLLAEEKQAELRWLNLGLALVVLGSCLLLAFVPTMRGVVMATTVAAIGSAMLALYSECGPGWLRWCFGPALLLVATLLIIERPFDGFLREGQRRGDDFLHRITVLIGLIGLLLILVRIGQEYDPYSSIRGLVIREGLQRRAAQGEPK